MKTVKTAEARLRADALQIFEAALQAADASRAVHRNLIRFDNQLAIAGLSLGLKAYSRTFLLAVGKAAVPMAQALGEILGDALTGRLVITKYGHTKSISGEASVLETGHPIPDEAGEQAARAVEQLLGQLTAGDLLLVAISGGASALLPAPAAPVTLDAKKQTTALLLEVGANIHELNAVRKHLSYLKGGRLARLAHPATVLSLLLSDVVGDAIDVIGSGPTAPDESTFADALAVLQRFDLLGRVPVVVRSYLESGACDETSETVKAPEFASFNVHNFVIGSNRLALAAASEKATLLGYRTLILSSSIEGETRDVASVHAQILREVAVSGNPVARPACILSGGETTVTIRGPGNGGRNQEFALATASGIAGIENVLVLSAGTDGTDGPTDAAGAIATGTTNERAGAQGLKIADYLASNNSYPFFESLGDLIRTGPTGTNVMDIHILLAG